MFIRMSMSDMDFERSTERWVEVAREGVRAIQFYMSSTHDLLFDTLSRFLHHLPRLLVKWDEQGIVSLHQLRRRSKCLAADFSSQSSISSRGNRFTDRFSQSSISNIHY